MLLAALFSVALVVQDQASLRAAAQDSAPRQATLWQGEWLEVRGERQGFVQVYDHRRERPGYLRQHQVRIHTLDEKSAPQLAAVVDFLRDTPGAEALGIGYAAALLKAAPPDQVSPELFEALGSMADRLAQRASTLNGRDKEKEAAMAAHLDVVASYGVKMKSFEREGRTRVCYDGEAFRRALALGGSPLSRVRSALALTRPECVDPSINPVERQGLDEWRAMVLEQVDASRVPLYLANRLHLRRAEVSATLAYGFTRRGEVEKAAKAQGRALAALAVVEKSELADEDKGAYARAAVRVGATRWASELPPPNGGGLRLEAAAGGPGETCLKLRDAKGEAPLLERCTFGVVWLASARASGRGNALAVAVQMLEGWTELWLFHRDGEGWKVDALAPAATEPKLGYVELAGFTPDGTKLLVAREALVDGRVKSSFQVLGLDTLAPEKSADKPDALSAFQRWSTADWRAGTLAVR
jgi:hypothetical protein